MWFFMWFCKILCQNLVMFKYTGWFYLLATLLDYTKVVWTLKAQKIGFLNDCTFVANFSKLQVWKITRETIQNANFEQRGPTPTLNFWYFFWFRMVPYGPNIDVPGFPSFFGWKVAFLQHSNVDVLSSPIILSHF